MSVLVHIHDGKAFNLDGFKMAMGRSWRCGSFSIQRLDNVFFQVFFGTQETVDFMTSNGPWNFENNLVIVCPRIRGELQLSHCLQKEYFWILLIGLSRYCYTMVVGSKLISQFDIVKTSFERIGL